MWINNTIRLTKLYNNFKLIQKEKHVTTTLKQKNNLIDIKQYITDDEGHKIAAIIDIEELHRLKELLKTIPPLETWLYKNKEAFESVQRGLKESSEGKISKLNLDEL